MIAQRVQVRDLQAAQSEFPEGAAYAKQYGHRTTLATPLLREGHPIGAILLRRKKVSPFTDEQIELVSTFADQAVIAIENTRLFEAEQQRTRELTESLEQQTATSEVLRVISSSPGELQPVFDAMLEKAVRICGAGFGNLWLREADGFRIAAIHGAPREFQDFVRREPLFRPSPDIGLGQIVNTKQVYQVGDARAAPTFGDKLRIATIELAGARTLLGVPMLKDGEVIGVLAIYRREVRQFTDKQIELVKNFAAQAVIAIENTRLLNELRQRTTDLTEALEQQTATSEVLSVISSSPGKLEPVFQAMLENATRICGAKYGIMYRHNNGEFQPAAMCGVSQEVAEYLTERGTFRSPAGSPLTELARTKKPINISDIANEQTFASPRASKLGGARSFLSVPMLKDDELVGTINIYRQEVSPSPTSRSSCLRTSPPRPSSPSRIRGCSMNCAQFAGAANGDLRSIASHQFKFAWRLWSRFSKPSSKRCTNLPSAIRYVDTYDGTAFRTAALYNPPPQFALRLGERHAPLIQKVVSRYVARTMQIAHIEDLRTRQPYLEGRQSCRRCLLTLPAPARFSLSRCSMKTS